MNLNRLKVGIIGCGYIAQKSHIPAFAKLREVSLVAICDKHEELARHVAKRFNIAHYYSSLSDMLREQKIDVVDICTPPDTHASLCIAAIEAGCHVLVEKPMVLTVKEADALIHAAKKQGIKLCVVHDFLYWPSMIKARALVKSGAVGDVIGVEIKHFEQRNDYRIMDRNHWYHRLPMGVFGHTLPHALYLSMEFLGRVNPVAVYVTRLSERDWIPFDEARVVLKGERGIATILLSCNSCKGVTEIDIYGTKMNLHVASTLLKSKSRASRFSAAMENITHSVQLASQTALNGARWIVGRYHTSHYTLISQFIRAILTNTEPPVTPEEGREVVRVFEKIVGIIGQTLPPAHNS